MRVISGKYKGKSIIGFDINGTRPTMDRVKESMMAMIQGYLKDASCLDLFAGSGSLGIEALSNGAESCTFVDNNIKLIEIIKENTKTFKDDIKIIHKDFKLALEVFENKFDIIFLDPPYKLNLINECLELIKKYDLLNTDGIIVLEYETEEINPLDFNVLKERKYGSKYVKILSKN